METRALDRRTEIDVAKGFALFLVVFAHVLDRDSIWAYWIFMFHMPVFFFLSGMTFRPEKYKGLPEFLKDKWKKRVVPYLIVTFIGLCICMIRPDYRQPVLDRGWKDILLWIFYYGQPVELYVGQIWFLMGLFMAELFAYLWFRILGQRPLWVRCYSLLFLGWAAVNMNQVNDVFRTIFPMFHRLPWKMDTGVCAAVFLIAGYYTTKTKLLEKTGSLVWFLIPFCTWLSYYFGPRIYGYVNMCDCTYSPGPFFFLVAFLGSASLVFTAFLCKNWKFWEYCGRHSLPMFSAQTFAIYWVLEGIAKITGQMYIPRHTMPGHKVSLFVSIGAFALMVIFVYPWHVYQKKRAEGVLFLRKTTKK